MPRFLPICVKGRRLATDLWAWGAGIRSRACSSARTCPAWESEKNGWLLEQSAGPAGDGPCIKWSADRSRDRSPDGSIEPAAVPAHGADGEATLRVQLEEARAAVGPAVEPGRHRAPAHPANRGRSSDDGRMVCTRKHEVVRSFLPRLGAVWALAVGSCCSSRVGRSSDNSVPGRGSQSYLVGRCSDLLSVPGVHLRRIENGVGSPACQLSRPRHGPGKAPFGPRRTANVIRHWQRATSLRRAQEACPCATIRFKSHNLVTIAPWLRSPDRSWQTLDN
jgi:hypothetical protein